MCVYARRCDNTCSHRAGTTTLQGSQALPHHRDIHSHSIPAPNNTRGSQQEGDRVELQSCRCSKVCTLRSTVPQSLDLARTLPGNSTPPAQDHSITPLHTHTHMDVDGRKS